MLHSCLDRVCRLDFSLVQSLDRFGRLGDTGDDSAEVLFQSFLQEAIVSSSGMDRDVHYLMLSVQHFLCRPRQRPPFNGALKDGL